MSKKLLCLFVLLISCFLPQYGMANSQEETSLSPLYQLPVTWTDDKGKTVSLANWKGKTVVMSMAYSTCRKFCPLTLARLLEIQKLYNSRRVDAEFIIISYDPINDTWQNWAEYRKTHNLYRDNWHFLTGNQESTKTISQMLGMDYWLYDEHVMHNFKIVRLNARGDIDKTLDWNSQDELDSFLQ